jgi:hypothetical protein
MGAARGARWRGVMSYLLDLMGGWFENDGSRYGSSVGRNSEMYQRRRRGFPEPTRPKPRLCEAGCGRPARDLDHCHLTHAFRGWLCHQCNVALGMARDQPALLRALADYLERT